MITPQPIGSLSPQAFAALQVPPSPVKQQRGVRAVGGDDRRMHALAALEPAEDPELPPLVLAFTDDDEKEMRRLSEDLEEAYRLAAEAEQRHTAAARIAKTLPWLLDKSGQLAARAIGGDKAAKQAVKDLNAQIDEARLAESALKTLAEESAEAARFRDGSYGRLRSFTNNALAAMRLRAAAEYTRLAEEMRRCLAAIDVSIELQHKDRDVQAISAGWYCLLGNLRVPAMLPEHRQGSNGVEFGVGGELLISHDHGYLTFQRKAIRSKLISQIETACGVVGLTPTNLL
jgi:hypothetical protein